MSKQQGRGGMGSHKHGISGKAGPPNPVKYATARLFNQEAERKKKKKSTMYASVHEALKQRRRK